ncbi:MAG TPA: hypothetical protein VD908_19640 [Cytophagales bacterium]|nr:hypothetical protein [Cytophagales bacterium]
MKYLSFILVSLLCLSCNIKKEEARIEGSKHREVKNDTSKLKTTGIVDSIKFLSGDIIQPCDEIQTFVSDIEKVKWVSDTNRLKEVGIYNELDRSQIKFFNTKPFYNIHFENSKINQAYNTETFKDDLDSLDFELFKSVNNIFGYFYRKRTESDLIADGVIEQWEFENEEQAEKALKNIRRSGFIIYFNTQPYFCRLRNNLIIFQTRAMAFSYEQRLLFEKFVKEKEASL